jgi:hypothetical protein
MKVIKCGDLNEKVKMKVLEWCWSFRAESWFRWAVSCIAVTAVCGGCRASEELESSPVGTRAWDSDDVSCRTDADCNAGETCEKRLCQMKRCGEPSYTSRSPLGTTGYFSRDREVVVAFGGTELQGYDLDDRAFVRPQAANWTSPSGPIVDIAGGDLLGSRPEALARITEGSQLVQVQSGANVVGTLSLPFAPVAVAVGDTDADGVDEVVATSEDAQLAVCNALTKECKSADATPAPGQGQSAGPLEIVDVAAGDVDGDGYAEAVLLTTRKSLIVVNFDSDKTGNTKLAEHSLENNLARIAAGDLDGDGVDDVVGLYDGFFGDDLRVFSLKGGALASKQTLGTSGGAIDLVVGMFGSRERPEIALLRDDDSIEMFVLDNGKLASEYTGLLASTGVRRIATADIDGDSPARRVVGQPKLVAGPVVPIAVLTLPPYSRTHSDGRSRVSMGREGSTSESKLDGTVFSVQAGLGFEQGLSVFADVVKVSVEAHYTQEWSRDHSVTNELTTSTTFQIEARPEMEGFNSGAVVLGCGCYHKYDYALEDPARKLGEGADGKVFSVFVPVDAQTRVFSTRRYNALAKALAGPLPKVEIPFQLGQVASYSKEPRTLEGKVIPEEDMVFRKPPTLRASDVAETVFDLSVAREETSETMVRRGGGISSSIGVFGVTAKGEVDVSVGKGYGVGVSEASSFSGTIPPLRNDPSTPEDELEIHGYSVTPLIYRQRYKSRDGEGAFFVLTYAVGD